MLVSVRKLLWIAALFLPALIIFSLFLDSPCSIEFDFISNKPGIFQLFYSNNLNLSEEKSYSVNFNSGENHIKINLPCFTRKIRYLRVDPTYVPNTTFLFGNVRLYTGIFCYTVPFSQIDSKSVSGVALQTHGFLTTDNDPQFFWKLSTVKKKSSMGIDVDFKFVLCLLLSSLLCSIIAVSLLLKTRITDHLQFLTKIIRRREFSVTVKIILVSAIILFSYYLLTNYISIRVVLDSSQCWLSEINHRREYTVKGENHLCFCLPKNNSYEWKLFDCNNATFRIDHIVLEDGLRRIVLDPSDVKKMSLNNVQYAGGRFVVSGNNPVITFDVRSLKKTGKLHFTGLSLYLLFLDLILIILIIFFDVTGLKRLTEHYVFLRTRYFLYVMWFLLLMLLTAAGITGSSIGQLQYYNTCRLTGEKILLGKYQPVRSDEYLAHGTAAAIINYNHTPKFPLINTNVGLEGRNMLFLHDWGAPVRHMAILLKPATWGFFLLDLRRALSWYWLFPVFFGVFSMWYLLDVLFPKVRCFWNFAIALAAGFAPYSVVWSFWPLNCASGILLGTAVMIQALKQLDMGKGKMAILLAVAASLALSLSGATLYFPHFYPVMILGFFILIYKICCSDKKILSAALLLFYILAFSAILGVFLYCIKDALTVAMNSVYPGKRILQGGDLGIQTIIKANFIFFNFAYPLRGSVCDSQLFPVLFIILPVAYFYNQKKLIDKKIFIPLFLFAFFAVWYQIIGFPKWFSYITLWSRVLESRASYAVIICQMILLAALLNTQKSDHDLESENKTDWQDSLLKLFFAALLTLSCFYVFYRNHKTLVKFLPYLILLDTGFIFLYSFLLLKRLHFGVFIFVLVTIFQGLSFNPVCIAPTEISSPVLTYINSASGKKYEGRTLLIDNYGDAAGVQSSYAMAGGKTLTGFFCYEDMTFYQKFFSKLPHPEQFHRLNHLSVRFDDKSTSSALNASIIQKDVIRINISPSHFDFSQFPIDFVTVQNQFFGNGIQKNRSLKFEFDAGYWKIFRVIHRDESPEKFIHTAQLKQPPKLNLKPEGLWGSDFSGSVR